jgi:tetratricopeptide (TPR) repeat protein
MVAMDDRMNTLIGESPRDPPPSPLEDSDSSDEPNDPLVLKQVLADLIRFTKELGSTHQKVAETWNTLGLIRLHMQRNIKAAMKCHEEALSIYKATGGSTIDVAVTLNDLGRCYERLNDIEKALEIYERAECLIREDKTARQNHGVMDSLDRAVARLRRL